MGPVNVETGTAPGGLGLEALAVSGCGASTTGGIAYPGSGGCSDGTWGRIGAEFAAIRGTGGCSVGLFGGGTNGSGAFVTGFIGGGAATAVSFATPRVWVANASSGALPE